MNRVRGWAETGRRLVDRVVAGHWETNTLVHAVALNGTRAAMILDGPVDGVSFAGFCEHFLAPALQPGDLVVLDNLSSHKSTAATQAVESVGARLVFLPPYSPDLNPIENIFSKLKQLVRGLRPKTWEQIIEAAKRALQQISLDDICNAIVHAGYAAT
jgi:transposase